MESKGSNSAAVDSTRRILIVDDEGSIRKTLEDVLRDEGYAPHSVSDGQSALDLIGEQRPGLVLLDIWMPGLDGLETLRRIKEICPDLPVIMISGHATIATAVQATRMGAADFIEKPFDLEHTLNLVKRHLAGEQTCSDDSQGQVRTDENAASLRLGDVWECQDIDPIAFSQQPMRGKKIVQRTLAHSALLYGQGLHSGKKSGLVIEPLPANSGIHFVGVSHPQPVPAHVEFVESTGFATTVKLGATQAGTIEHLMSALCAYGITNVLVKCNGEVPVMDGSALEFCAAIESAGIVEQQGDWYAIAVNETIEFGEGRESIRIEPADEFIIDYTLDYPEPIGVQHMSFTFGDVEAYKREIAPARTFGFVKDIGYLHKQGLAQGGRFDNFVMIGDDGIINDTLRFPDEAVRHKILDAVGDLYLLGRPLQGKVTARMTGHSDNIALLKAIFEHMHFDAEQAVVGL